MGKMKCNNCKKGDLIWQKDAVKNYSVNLIDGRIYLIPIGYDDPCYDKDGVLYCNNNNCLEESDYYNSDNNYDLVNKRGIYV